MGKFILLKKCILLVIVLLFAGQTVAAAFDAHKAHQQNMTHHTLDENHQTHPEPTFSLVSINEGSSDSYQADCHHCCHCHSPSSVYILTNLPSLLANYQSLALLSVTSLLPSQLIAPEHRPPILS